MISRKAYDYLVRFNPVAAQRIAETLFIAGDSLVTFPNRGRPGQEPETRELTTVWPHVLVYRVQDDTVEIVRVWHGAQDRQGE